MNFKELEKERTLSESPVYWEIKMNVRKKVNSKSKWDWLWGSLGLKVIVSGELILTLPDGERLTLAQATTTEHYSLNLSQEEVEETVKRCKKSVSCKLRDPYGDKFIACFKTKQIIGDDKDQETGRAVFQATWWEVGYVDKKSSGFLVLIRKGGLENKKLYPLHKVLWSGEEWWLSEEDLKSIDRVGYIPL